MNEEFTKGLYGGTKFKKPALQKIEDDTVMDWGMYRGRQMADVPADYLIHIYNNFQLKANLKTYIKDNMDALKKEMEKSSGRRGDNYQSK